MSRSFLMAAVELSANAVASCSGSSTAVGPRRSRLPGAACRAVPCQATWQRAEAMIAGRGVPARSNEMRGNEMRSRRAAGSSAAAGSCSEGRGLRRACKGSRARKWRVHPCTRPMHACTGAQQQTAGSYSRALDRGCLLFSQKTSGS